MTSTDLSTIDAPTVWNTLDVFVTEYVRDYEMCDCEDENGNTGDYSPNENESALIDDAIQGLLADDDFVTLMGKAYLARQERRKAEGKCMGCGAPDGLHWGIRAECGASEVPHE